MKRRPAKVRKPAPRRRRKVAEASPEVLLGFVRAGGTLTMREWLRLDEATREVLAAAGDAVRARLALDIAAAVSGPAGAAEVSRAIDGGEAADEIGLVAALNNALGKGVRVPA